MVFTRFYHFDQELSGMCIWLHGNENEKLTLNPTHGLCRPVSVSFILLFQQQKQQQQHLLLYIVSFWLRHTFRFNAVVGIFCWLSVVISSFFLLTVVAFESTCLNAYLLKWDLTKADNIPMEWKKNSVYRRLSKWCKYVHCCCYFDEINLHRNAWPMICKHWVTHSRLHCKFVFYRFFFLFHLRQCVDLNISMRIHNFKLIPLTIHSV